MTHYPEHLLELINLFKKFPGIGAKSAERFAFEVIEWPEEKLIAMSEVLRDSKKKLIRCSDCGALIEQECSFCTRDENQLCIVASAKDIFLMEQTRSYQGPYHVLGALLSPIHGMIPSTGVIEKLKTRVQERNINEVIIALDSTLEGDATALYLKKELAPFGIKTSRLAFGIPMGSSLDYIDEGTLSRAFEGRLTY